MRFLLGLFLTPVAGTAGTLVLMLTDPQGLGFNPSALLIGMAVGSVLAAPVTLLVLPAASHAINGRSCDRPLTHAGVGLVAGAAWMLWVGFDQDLGVTPETIEFCLAGALGGTLCGALQWWIFERHRRRGGDDRSI